jgi:hypothetical protein
MSQTIITYDLNEVKELKKLDDIQTVKSENKIWIGLEDPTDEILQSFVLISIWTTARLSCIHASLRSLRSDY